MDTTKNSMKYRQEAIWHLCNEFPLVGSTAIESMFCSSRYSYIKARLALESLRIDPKCSPFLPSARPQIQFVITDTRLLLETCSLQQGSSNLTVRVHQAIKRLQALLGKLTVQCPRECERHGFRLFDIEKLESFFHSMLLRQMQLDEIGADAACDVAYHHTSSSNIESINRHGLLPRDEHQSKGIMPANKHGVTFGTGIYTCEKPKVFSRYGDKCLVLARLKGKGVRVPVQAKDESIPDDANCIIGNKFSHPLSLNACAWPECDDYSNEVVLRSASQCAALIHFSEAKKCPASCISLLQDGVQVILDGLFNHNRRRNPCSLDDYQIVNPHCKDVSWTKWSRVHTLVYYAPPTLFNEILTAPQTRNAVNQAECVICLDSLEMESLVSLQCGHSFHRKCIHRALMANPVCPTCRSSVGEPQGKSPSGTMTIMNDPRRCDGAKKSIVITYDIPAGVQLEYHEHPGKRHGRKLASAYLPDNSQGRQLLKRLKFAFSHGLTFTVGTSLTTGVADSCTWASIHHKTSLSEGAHGYPDSNYFCNCNAELDTLGVPSASKLDNDGTLLGQHAQAGSTPALDQARVRTGAPGERRDGTASRFRQSINANETSVQAPSTTPPTRFASHSNSNSPRGSSSRARRQPRRSPSALLRKFSATFNLTDLESILLLSCLLAIITRVSLSLGVTAGFVLYYF